MHSHNIKNLQKVLIYAYSCCDVCIIDLVTFNFPPGHMEVLNCKFQTKIEPSEQSSSIILNYELTILAKFYDLLSFT